MLPSIEKLSADAILPPPRKGTLLFTRTQPIVAIGISTGGPEALEKILTKLTRTCPGIVIVQHMPGNYTGTFARRLNSLCEVDVNEAITGDRVKPGRVLIAQGGKHMLIKRIGIEYVIQIVEGPPVCRHIPSVDVLFRSVATAAGQNAVGIIMTGIGGDGALGLREMRECGAKTYAQDEKSCTVYGMPREAMKIGAASEEITLLKVPEFINGIR
ncbi:MAG: CheB methylesterase domain-containing protein [Formivibrio sp.]|nr:CheB methylesterase domain-containing protein [Formivibrio sp.]